MLSTLTQENVINLIIDNIIKDTLVLIKVVSPKSLIYLAVDGPPPRAKMHQQRNRRYKYVISHLYKLGLLSKNNEREGFYFDTGVITPGTDFMYKLNEKLISAINTNRLKPDKYDHNLITILDGYQMPGEGEHKILRYIKDNRHTIGNKPICIYGDDADLIVLSMVLKKMNINILKTQSLNDYYAKIGYAYLSIPKFQSIFTQNNLLNVDKLNDFIFIMALFGNDFVKHIPSLTVNSYSFIIDIYTKVVDRNIIQRDEKINISSIKKLIQEIAKIEQSELICNHKSLIDKCRRPYTSKDTEQKNNAIDEGMALYQHSYYCQKENPYYNRYKPLFYMIDYRKPPAIWKKIYYKYYFDVDIKDESKIKNICLEYMKCLLFNIDYYIHNIPKWRYYYPYRVAPFASDLYRYIHIINNIDFTVEPNIPYTPFQQICLTAPREKFSMIPSAFQQIYREYPQYYPQVTLDMSLDALAGYKEIYSDVLLPIIDDNDILEMVEKIVPTIKYKKDIERNTLMSKPFVDKFKQQF